MNANIFAELVKRRLSKYTDSQAHRRNNRKKKENPFSNKRFHCLIFAWRVLFRRSRIIACRAFSAHSVSRRYSAQQPTSIGIRMILIHYINYLSDNIYSSSLSLSLDSIHGDACTRILNASRTARCRYKIDCSAA